MMNKNNNLTTAMYVQDARLQLLFLCEVFALYTFVAWTAWYTHLNPAFVWPVTAISLILFYLLLIAPITHRLLIKYYGTESDRRITVTDIWKARGLGSPIHLFRSTSGLRHHWKELGLTLLVFACLFLAVIDKEWTKISDALHLDANTSIFSVAIWLLPLMVVFTLVLLSFMARWDNFRAAMASVVRIVAIGTTVIMMLYWLLRAFPNLPLMTHVSALDKWQEFTLLTWMAQFIVYIFWAWLQQLFFLGVINTSLCHSFNTTTRSGFHAVAWTTALLFSLLHLPNIWLFSYTFCFGILIAYSFMRYRNLFAIAVAHAFLASLYYQLLPLPLSPLIKNYEGPGDIYLISRLAVFVLIPLTFTLLMWLQGRSLPWQKTALTILFIGILSLNYPNTSQGPEFHWGRNGNGKTWRLHSLVIHRYGPGYTEYKVTGRAPYVYSQPLVLSPNDAHTIEIDMALTPAKGDIGVIYPDYGDGHKEDVFTIFPLREGRQSYRIHPEISQPLIRVLIEIRAKPGALIRLYSLRLSADQGLENTPRP